MTSLWSSVAGTGFKGALHARTASVALADLATRSCLPGGPEALRGRSVLLAMREQLSAGLALLELDGVARRLILCTPDLSPQIRAEVAAMAEAGADLADLDPRPTSAPVERRGDRMDSAHFRHHRDTQARRAQPVESRRVVAAPDAGARDGLEHVL